MDELKRYEDKKVFVETKSGRHYSGEVVEINDQILTISDMFGKYVTIFIEDISVIEEKRI